MQFDHRLLAETTFAAVVLLWLGNMRRADGALHALAAAACLQLALGIATLLSVVDLPIAVLHQAGALVLLTAALVVRHRAGSLSIRSG